MKSKAAALVCAILSVLFISGCLYPNNQKAENRINPQESIHMVQAAVDAYQKNTGLLPIKNSEMDTPIYEKYVIDLAELLNRGYLGRIPGNAFENGGNNYYVLVNVEEQPEVKLLDLISLQKMGEIQRWVDQYMLKAAGSIPQDIKVAPKWFSIDYQKLGKERQQIKSIYSEQFLGLLIHSSGKVAIDYAPEIMRVIEAQGLAEPEPETDLRTLLVIHSYFVPAGSHPYYWIDNQPVISDLAD
jgi:hypothetical protein